MFSGRERPFSWAVSGAGVNAGVVDIPSGSTDIVYRDRDQWIAVYVADPTGPASSRMPDTDPFNIYNSGTGQYQRGRILRTSVRWPVDDVEYTNAANDFFTVVRFGSFVNSTLPSCKVSSGSGLTELGGTNCLGSFYSGNNSLQTIPTSFASRAPTGSCSTVRREAPSQRRSRRSVSTISVEMCRVLTTLPCSSVPATGSRDRGSSCPSSSNTPMISSIENPAPAGFSF